MSNAAVRNTFGFKVPFVLVEQDGDEANQDVGYDEDEVKGHVDSF